MTHLLDTDHLSLLQQDQSPDRTKVVANLNLCGGPVVACVISFHEQTRGCHNLVNQARTRTELVEAYVKMQKVIGSYPAFTVLPFDVAAAAVFDALKAAKVRVATMDLRIASVALANNLTLVTRNVSDFAKVPGLRTEDWTK